MGRSVAIALLLVACGEKQSPSQPAAPPLEAKAGEAKVGEAKPSEPDAAPFRVDVTLPGTCAHGTTCEATLALVALEGFKVNADYPFKFVGDVGPQISFDGTGTFLHGDKHSGRMTIKFRSEQAGTIKVSGTFKLSVCTDEVCKIEQPKITFDVPVT
jgi:hypothetical protein